MLLTLLPYRIQGFGCNCSIGPDAVARALREVAPSAKRYGIPLIAKPNAGMPVTTEEGLQYPLSPAEMAEAVEELTGLGDGAAEVLIALDAECANPIAVRGDETEITKLEQALCRKVR